MIDWKVVLFIKLINMSVPEVVWIVILIDIMDPRFHQLLMLVGMGIFIIFFIFYFSVFSLIGKF